MNHEQCDDEGGGRAGEEYLGNTAAAQATGWAAGWPATITLGELVARMDFDVWPSDDPGLVLVKTTVAVADIPMSYGVCEMAQNDAVDRFGLLVDGFYAGGRDVPPVVWLPGSGIGLRDGWHRAALAREARRERIPAYMPVEEAVKARPGGTGRPEAGMTSTMRPPR